MPINLVNGFPETPSGIIIPNGYVTFQLNVDATVVAAPGGFVGSDTPVTFQFNALGQIQPNPPAATAQIYSNAELNPQNSVGLGTYYLVTFYTQSGARLNQNAMWWQFPEAAGSTVDISQMIPYSTVGGNVIFYPTNFTIGPPGPTTLGGVFSNAGAAHEWIKSINVDGSVSLSQPAFTDISGVISSGQLPTNLISGSIALNQVAVGSGAGTIGGSSSFTFSGGYIAGASGVNFGGSSASSISSDGSTLVRIVPPYNGVVEFYDPRSPNAANALIWYSSTGQVTLGGYFTFIGSSSGSASIGPASNAGSPTRLNLPTTSGTINQVLTTDGGNPQQLRWTTIAGSGTVTSIGMTGDGVIFNTTVTASPVTSAGTLVPVLLTQTANYGLFGPTTGAAATPTFRAMVLADLPAIAASNLSNGVTGSGAIVLAVAPALTGNATAVTQISSDNSTKLATTAFVQSVALTAGAVTSVFGRAGVVVAATNDYNFNQLAGSIAIGQIPNSLITIAKLASVEGTGTKIQLTSAGTTVSGDLATYDGSGNVQDSGTGIATLAPLVSPTFTGVPAAPTAAVTTSTTQIATTAYVQSQKYAATFTSTSSLSVTGATHGLGTADLVVVIYDSATGTRNLLIPNTVSIDSTTFNVTVTFDVAQAGRIVILSV